MIRRLSCELSIREVRKRREELVETLTELEEHREQAADKKAELRNEEKAIEKRVAKLLQEIREGAEIRPVECEEREVFEQNMVQVVRTDTGQPVEERAMRVEERQVSAFDEDGNPTNGEATPEAEADS